MSNLAYRKVEAVVAGKDRQAAIRKPACVHVKIDEELAGEAWARSDDELQRTKMLWTAQATHIHGSCKEESDKCKAELRAVTDEYIQAANACTHLNSELHASKIRWTRQSAHFQEQGQAARNAYAAEPGVAQVKCTDVYKHMDQHQFEASAQAQKDPCTFQSGIESNATKLGQHPTIMYAQ